MREGDLMPKMTKAQAKKRMLEAAAKIRRVYNETPSEWWPRNFFMWVVKTNDEITQKVEKMK